MQKAVSNGLGVFAISVGNLSFLNPFKITKLVRFYRSQQIDTVIFSTSQDVKLGSFAAKLAGVKSIVYLRGLAVPVKKSLSNRIIFKRILTHIVANSQATKQQILKHLSGIVPEEKVAVIYHGIDLVSLDLQSHKIWEIVEKAKGIVLGNAGRLTFQKGQKYLIEMARLLKERQVEFTVFIAGTGEMDAELKALIEKYGLLNEVILLGFVNDMEAFMNSIDIFVLSSEWEGFGYVLVEAMIKAKPVVAFDISSNPEIVTANETGFLVNFPDFNALADKTQLLIQDNQVRTQMGVAAQNSVINRFNLDDRITEFEYYLLGKE
jgi:glycosyltransferase involved in cell wall biosynthesis